MILFQSTDGTTRTWQFGQTIKHIRALSVVVLVEAKGVDYVEFIKRNFTEVPKPANKCTHYKWEGTFARNMASNWGYWGDQGISGIARYQPKIG